MSAKLVEKRTQWKWRVVHTLLDAQAPLTFRQVCLRCGVLSTQTSSMRTYLSHICRELVKDGIAQQVKHGVYALSEAAP